jgi:hypothetical protein
LIEIITTTKSGAFSVTEEGAIVGDASVATLVIAAIIIAVFIIRRRK